MSELTFAVCSFGERSWQELAERRAVPSVLGQAPVVRVHGTSLAQARNEALRRVRTEFVSYIDADDEASPGFADRLLAGSADLRAPAVQYVTPGRARAPYVPRVPGHRHAACVGGCLVNGNWIVVGAMVRADLLREAGGWWDEPIYEDWSAWLRCWKAGASVEAIPEAVYRAHVRLDSRNRAPSMAIKNEWHRRITETVLGKEAA